MIVVRIVIILAIEYTFNCSSYQSILYVLLRLRYSITRMILSRVKNITTSVCCRHYCVNGICMSSGSLQQILCMYVCMHVCLRSQSAEICLVEAYASSHLRCRVRIIPHFRHCHNFIVFHLDGVHVVRKAAKGAAENSFPSGTIKR